MWSMDAIIAVVVFLVAFLFILPFITDLTDDGRGETLEEQALTIETVVAANRPVSFVKGAQVESKKFSYLTSLDYDVLKEEFGITGDFCIYFEKPDGSLIYSPDENGDLTVVGIGDPRVRIDGQSCKTMFGECVDNDRDGYGGGDACIDYDCDDDDGAIYPGAPEICDGKINSCGSGAADGEAERGGPCGSVVGECRQGTNECESGSLRCVGAVDPQTEVCDGVDNDCDGIVDEGCLVCTDADGDGFGVGSGCSGPDCNDGDYAINPNAAEICDNIDNDCDGSIDEGNPGGGARCGSAVGACTFGTKTCAAGVFECAGAVMPRTEVCDGVDNDCDGIVDEGCGVCADSDVDGHYSLTSPASCGANDDCDDTNPSVYLGAAEVCDGVDNDCDGIVDEGCPVCTDADADTFSPEGGACGSIDCDDSLSSINPGAAEVCDGVDNNCDGTIDEGCAPACMDLDGDTFSTEGGACGSIDCDDTRSTVFPGAAEICNARDDDCDGSVDEGNPSGGASCGATDVGACEYGTMTCGGGVLSCVGEITPTLEICDGLDNDCDGSVNEGLMLLVYRDADGDGYGNPSRTLFTCSSPAGYVGNNLDCNDGTSGINPGATDYCNNWIDEDCSGSPLRDDTDGDGWQDSSCGGRDCNDLNSAINPDALEILDDGLDNNCNGCNAKSGVPPSLFAICFTCERDGVGCPSGCCWG